MTDQAAEPMMSRAQIEEELGQHEQWFAHLQQMMSEREQRSARLMFLRGVLTPIPEDEPAPPAAEAKRTSRAPAGKK